MINKQMIIALAIHIVMVLFSLLDPEYSITTYITGGVLFFNLIGILLILLNKKIIGARVFLVSSVILVPIGLIGAFGANRILDEEKKKNFYNEQNN